MDETETLSINFHPIFGVASVLVESYGGVEMILSLIVTISELKQLNYNALLRQGTIDINKQYRVYRHDVDFDVLGKKLKEDAEDRGDI